MIAIDEQTEQDERMQHLSEEEKAAMSLVLEDRMLSAARNLDFEAGGQAADHSSPSGGPPLKRNTTACKETAGPAADINALIWQVAKSSLAVNANAGIRS